jgi:hypothetical protein
MSNFVPSELAKYQTYELVKTCSSRWDVNANDDLLTGDKARFQNLRTFTKKLAGMLPTLLA